MNVKKGVDPAKVEAAIADEWKKFLETVPTEDELERAKTSRRAGFVRGLENVGGFGGKAPCLPQVRSITTIPVRTKDLDERKRQRRKRPGCGTPLDQPRATTP